MNLNQEQKAWVKDASDFIDENFFVVAGGDESEFIKTDLGKSYEKLMIRRSELFTREQAMKFCLTIGDDSTLINSVGVILGDGIRVCNCTSSLCAQCPNDEDCATAYCNPSPDGCGCFGVWRCTGRCSLGLPILTR
jgi:hypothetical protein